MAGREIKPTPRKAKHSYSILADRRLLVAIVGCLILVIALIGVYFALNAGDNGQSRPSSAASESPAASDEDGPTRITLSFAGDCTLGTDEGFDYSTSFNASFEDVGDPSWFFANVKDIFADDDLTIVNMEGTLTTAEDREDKTYAFKGAAEYAQVLVEGDVEAASLANNHSQDYGEQSYYDTIDVLEGDDIKTFGYDRIAYFDVKDVKIALIGTYELSQGLDVEDEMVENIQTAQDAGAQIIVVYAHWGIEREYVPDDTQIELAHAAVDAGATVVIGSHPHVIQGYEKYHGRYIVYSLGNFCFGGNQDPPDKDCLIFQQTFTVEDGQVADDDDIEAIVCSVSSTSSSNNYQPTPAEGSEKDRIEEKLEESNEDIAVRSAALSGDEG